MIPEFDFVVVGAGMAGASIAAHLAETSSVCLIEMEDQPGYHSTGRSAAMFSENYGNAIIRALTRASAAFFYAPPQGFTETELLRPRRVLATASRPEDLDALRAVTPAQDCEVKTVDEAMALCPIVNPEGLVGALLSLRPADIEVHALHQGYLRQFKAAGGVLRLSDNLVSLERRGGRWTAQTSQGAIGAATVVNAAGAWAGEVGRCAGAQDIGLRPLKRTACLIAAPDGADIEAWPMLKDAGEQYYLKPDAGMLLLSPCDETLTAPSDVQADEMTVAIAVDRIERATTLRVKRVTHRWAGLRSFVEDRSPVVGFDAVIPGFFWHAALGGYGIQTAPALSRLAAALARGWSVDDETLSFGVELGALAPSRLAPSAKAPV
jgi:D-arginine dehydrogenase